MGHSQPRRTVQPPRLPETPGIKSASLAVEIFDPGRLARTLGSENKHYPAGPCVARTLVQSFLVISLTLALIRHSLCGPYRSGYFRANLSNCAKSFNMLVVPHVHHTSVCVMHRSLKLLSPTASVCKPVYLRVSHPIYCTICQHRIRVAPSYNVLP